MNFQNLYMMNGLLWSHIFVDRISLDETILDKKKMVLGAGLSENKIKFISIKTIWRTNNHRVIFVRNLIDQG